MSEIQIGGQTLATQTGTADPVITSNVNFTGVINSTATGTFSGTNTGTISGTISSLTTFPAGHVVQIVFNQHDGFVTSTGASMQPTGLKVQITPKFENSKFYVFGGGPLNVRPSGYGAGVSIYARNTLGTMSSWNLLSGKLIAGGYLYDGGSSDTWTEGNSQGYGAGPSYNLGETLEFEIYFGSIGPGGDGSTTVRFGHTDFSGNIMAMEITG